MSGHNIIGEPTTEIIPDLIEPGDWVVRGKKRYSPFRDTDLAFLLERRLQVDTLILAGINTTSCVLCCGFEATNRDYRVVIAADAVDSMDGEEMHRFALRLMAATESDGCWLTTTSSRRSEMSGLEVVEALWRLHEALNPPAEQNVAQRLAPGAAVETDRFQCFERLLLFGIERHSKFSLG